MKNALDDFRKKYSLTYRRLAEMSSLSLYAVYRHCRSGLISAESAVIYNRNLKIPLHELRPDLWPEAAPPAQAPSQQSPV